jgi:hypothetical protein
MSTLQRISIASVTSLVLGTIGASADRSTNLQAFPLVRCSQRSDRPESNNNAYLCACSGWNASFSTSDRRH